MPGGPESGFALAHGSACQDADVPFALRPTRTPSPHALSKRASKCKVQYMYGTVLYMTVVHFTANYVTQQELRAAYTALGHSTAFSAHEYDATLLIDANLTLRWACPKVTGPPLMDMPDVGWHVIAEAGALDWPPLRPEDECWRNLLAKYPVPTGERAQEQARMYGTSVEQLHFDQLRHHYLSPAHRNGMAVNKTDVNFSPLVRDWSVTARALADFLDTHRPPRLTAEQRVIYQGAHLVELENQIERTKERLARLVRNAAHEQRTGNGRLRHGFKSDVAGWTRRSRVTIDNWLSQGGPSEHAIHDENGNAFPRQSYADIAGIPSPDDEDATPGADR